MTTDKAKPLTAREADNLAYYLSRHGLGICNIGALRAISEGRHVVIEAGELDAMRETIRQQDSLLDERKAGLERLRQMLREARDVMEAWEYNYGRRGRPIFHEVVLTKVCAEVGFGGNPHGIAAIDAAQQEGTHDEQRS